MVDRCEVGRFEAILTDERCNGVLGAMYDKNTASVSFWLRWCVWMVTVAGEVQQSSALLS